MGRDAAATRARLLDAATAEFARHGLAGARVDRIAATAGANKERLYSYFGSKENLFGEVLTARLSELARALPVTPAALTDVRAFAGAVFDYHRAHPELVRLLQWEALAYGEDPVPDEDERTADYARKVDVLAASLATRSPAGAPGASDDRAGDPAGEPVGDTTLDTAPDTVPDTVPDTALDAAHLLLLVLALCLWPAAMPPLTRMTVGHDRSPDETRAAVVEAAARLAAGPPPSALPRSARSDAPGGRDLGVPASGSRPVGTPLGS